MPVSVQHRLLYEVPLKPVQGERFQPTGFPDIGHAVFERPLEDGGAETVLLVESAQSMANHLEATGWDEIGQKPLHPLDRLPWVEVVSAADSSFLTSSRTEAHRLASAFIKDAVFEVGDNVPVDGKELVRRRLGLRDDVPIAPRAIASALLKLDPLSLVHGVFFAEGAKVWPGQPKVARALTAFVEAIGAQRAESGGVKKDHVRHSLSEGEGGTSEGYGTVPFHRTEWVARQVTAYFCLDRDQLRSYGLGPEATQMLEAVALLEVRSLVDGGFRLRTACDLFPLSEDVADQSGVLLPSAAELTSRVLEAAKQCAEELGGGLPLIGKWQPKRAAKASRKPVGEDDGEEQGD